MASRSQGSARIFTRNQEQVNMQLRTLILSSCLATGASVVAQAPVFHYFQATQAVDPGLYKQLIEEVSNIDPSAVVGHSDDWTVLQVKSTTGLIESAYRTAIEQTGIMLAAGTPDLEALGLVPATDPNAPPVYLVTGDANADLARYQNAVDQWNAAHPEQQMSRTPVHQTGK